MITGFTQRVALVGRFILPFVSTYILILLGSLSWPLPYIGGVIPFFGLVGIYYWAIYRPDLMGPVSAFALGLLNDAVNFFPLGFSAFVYVAVYQLSLSQRRFFVNQIFTMLWAGFSLVVLSAAVFGWIFFSWQGGLFYPFLPIALQSVLTLLMFPFPAWILIRLQRLFLSQG